MSDAGAGTERTISTMPNELEAISRAKQTGWETRTARKNSDNKRRSASLIRDLTAPGEAWDFPAPEVDSFSHTVQLFEAYSNYNEQGEYENVEMRILPRRYYNGSLSGVLYHNGHMVSRVALLEEAVTSGAVVLDEQDSVGGNMRRAEKALIEDKAKTLYPWSTSLYSDDELYRIHTEGEGGIRTERAYLTASDGTKISAEEVAEQLAGGVLPEDMEDDTYRFLWDLDRELCTKARMIGQAVRSFRLKDQQLGEGQITEPQFLRAVHVYSVYFFGHDDGMSTAQQLRDALQDPQFPRKALKGIIAGSEPTSIYRRPVILRDAFEPPPPAVVRKPTGALYSGIPGY